jgi:hypothetical protein
VIGERRGKEAFAAQARDDGFGEQFGITQGVGGALRRDGVHDDTGVAD